VIKSLNRLLASLRPSASTPAAECLDDVIVLTPSSNASVDYIVLPYLGKQGRSSCIVNARTSIPENILPGRAATVVIVRFLFMRWLPWLRSFRAAGGRIVYFMDDDLMDPDALHGLPDNYAKSIRKFGIGQRQTLESLCHAFWVASPYLARKYQCWKPELIEAVPSMGLLCNTVKTSICYHGTGSHQAELSWLQPIVAQVLEHSVDVAFEIFGDHHINRAYRQLPRVMVLHPMSWPNYVAYTSSVTRQIALAPLLPTPFNAARGITKFFDFARMGAVGIYSNVEPYRDFVRHGVDGLLVDGDPQAWKEAISWLVNNPEKRAEMTASAIARARELTCD
jgi:hypothetical protein